MFNFFFFFILIASIRYSNTLQYQQQLQQQQQQESQRIESSGSIQRSNTSSRLADKSKDNVSMKSSLTSSIYKSTSTATYPAPPYTVDDNSFSSSEESINQALEEEEHNNDDEEEKTDDEEFSSHFERMKMQVEEPAFLPRQSKKNIGSSSSNGLQNSRQALSMSIQNLKRLHTDKVNSEEVPLESSSATSSQHSTKTSSTQPQSPVHSPAANNFQISTAPGSSNESAMNSIGSSFSDISDSSVTQSALEEAFLSKFNQGSKM